MDGIGRHAGIDWAKDGHAVCVIEGQGRVVARFGVEHTAAGLRELIRRLRGVDGVAIERPGQVRQEPRLPLGRIAATVEGAHREQEVGQLGLAACSLSTRERRPDS
jgi:hypothetical protein